MSTWGRAQDAMSDLLHYDGSYAEGEIQGEVGKLVPDMDWRTWSKVSDLVLDVVGPIFQETAERPHRKIVWRLAQSEPGVFGAVPGHGFGTLCRYCDGTDAKGQGQGDIVHEDGCIWVEAKEQIAKEREDMGKAMRLASIGVGTDAFDMLADIVSEAVFDRCPWCGMGASVVHDADCTWLKAKALIIDEEATAELRTELQNLAWIAEKAVEGLVGVVKKPEEPSDG